MKIFLFLVDKSFWDRVELMSDDEDSEESDSDDETTYETETDDESDLEDADKVVNIVSNLDGVEMPELEKMPKKQYSKIQIAFF